MSNKEIIQQLNALDLSTYPYDKVLELVDQFQPKVLTLTLDPIYIIERLRPDENVFKREEMSYRPASMNTKPQRATLPGKTAFYGTLCHINDPLTNNRMMALSEASHLFRKGLSAEGTETYTISRWISKTPLRLAVFADKTVFPQAGNNALLQSAKQAMSEKKTFLDDVFQFDDYTRYVTEQFAKPVNNDYEYLITATVADRLMYASKLDGLLYPSVQCQGEYGMNIALKPSVADRSLVLQQAHELQYIQKDGRGSLNFTKHFVPGDHDANGFKNWTYTEIGDTTENLR